MIKYLRVGEIPNDEKSKNYLTNEFEDGVSVFELNNNMPVLNTLRLLSSYADRIEKKHYIVTGEVVGKGNDGELLLINCVIINEEKIIVSDRVNYIHEHFKKIFAHREVIMNKQICFSHLKDGKDIYHFSGYYYSDPCDESFDYTLGYVTKDGR